MNSTATYIYGPTGRIAKRTTVNQESNIFYYHTDHLGSTRLVTDENKNIVSASTYHPFGDPDTEEGEEPHLFTGKEKDTTGLYYYGARHYDPRISTFITRDQECGMMKCPGTLNRYSYCGNNPLAHIDPDGCSYFRPEWGQGRDRTWSIGWAYMSYLMWDFKNKCEGLAAWHNFRTKHEFLSGLITATGVTGVSVAVAKAAGTGAAAGGPLGAAAGFIASVAVLILNEL
jgi:RHS repeat-associated protein